jgi:hypothetical protein
MSAVPLAWAAVAAWTLLIFATVPFARAIEASVVAAFGEHAFLVGVLAVVALAALLAWRALARLGVRARVAVGLGLAIYAGAAWWLRGNPVEAVHVVEYGVLGLLALRALAYRARDAWLAPSAALLALSVGTLDEALQWLTPARVWDLRDITVNGLAGAGAPLLLAFGVRPAWAQQPASARGARRFVALLALAWTLLGASCLNTSARVAQLARRAPALGLAAKASGMVDYGELHVLESGGEFPSRLGAEAWRAQDRARAASAGAALAENVRAAASAPADAQPSPYDAFLAEHSAVRDPFLHELRVHLFRRDRYVETAERHLDDPAWRARDLTVAVRENEFLEQHAPETLRAGGVAWSAAERAERERLALAGPYRSRVAEGVVTRVRERHVAIVWAAGLVALGFAYARLRGY